MCANYSPFQRQMLRDVFGVESPPGEWRSEAWPDYPAPIIRSSESGVREAVLGTFSMVPKGKIAPGIGKLSSFAMHWKCWPSMPDISPCILRALLGDRQSRTVEDRPARVFFPTLARMMTKAAIRAAFLQVGHFATSYSPATGLAAPGQHSSGC